MRKLGWKLQLELENCVMGLMFYIGPTVGAKCSSRLTGGVFVRGLSSPARAPSFCSVSEYLKRSEQRGALAAV